MATISDEKLRELLEKVRKGSTSSMTVAQYTAVLEAIGGSTAPALLAVPAGWSEKYDYREMLKVDRAGELLALLRPLAVSAPPAKLREGDVYVLDLQQEASPERWGPEYVVITAKPYVAVKGLQITMPDGRQTIVYQTQEHLRLRDYLEKRISLPKLNTYVVSEFLKTTDFQERATALLGKPAHEPAAPRTRENTGTCPVCFENIKLSPAGLMVLHGFKRPQGWGLNVGRCFGVDFPPFETSVRGVSAYLSALRSQLETLDKEIGLLESGEVAQIYTDPRKTRSVTPDDPSWSRHLSGALRAAQGTRKELMQTVEAFARLEAKWRPRPLPREGEAQIRWFTEGQK